MTKLALAAALALSLLSGTADAQHFSGHGHGGHGFSQHRSFGHSGHGHGFHAPSHGHRFHAPSFSHGHKPHFSHAPSYGHRFHAPVYGHAPVIKHGHAPVVIVKPAHNKLVKEVAAPAPVEQAPAPEAVIEDVPQK